MEKYTLHAERFWSKVNKDGPVPEAYPELGPCWLWTAGKNSGRRPYGRFKLKGKMELAHRVAYALANGPIPDSLFVDHRCHNEACVNPKHLRLATNKQNVENHTGALSNSKSGIRGVYWYKAYSKWSAQVRHQGKCFHLGYFTDKETAAKAVVAKRNELFTHNDRDKVGTLQTT